MQPFDQSVISPSQSALSTNKVLRNTYSLLAMTLIFSGITATISTLVQVPPMFSLISMIAAMLLAMFVLPKQANSSSGIVLVFVITGLLGFSLGPILNQYLAMQNGAQIITLAFAGTGVIFLGLSGYVLTTKRDFSFLGGFLMVGFLVVLVAIVANIFFNIPALSLAISSAVIFIMSGFILYDTSRIINGGETNYIMATIGLYINIFNIFIHLLNILGIMSDD
ncbi:MAG: Bax inhibitor-1/YccA family protein [gamma proteobacterium symbiont of Bathyaustriella thionipta]|nr:Bax inhibitor-1/YccA family protein [gamma proteobacterium symbiont of Bathyaustriella thionipta]